MYAHVHNCWKGEGQLLAGRSNCHGNLRFRFRMLKTLHGRQLLSRHFEFATLTAGRMLAAKATTKKTRPSLNKRFQVLRPRSFESQNILKPPTQRRIKSKPIAVDSARCIRLSAYRVKLWPLTVKECHLQKSGICSGHDTGGRRWLPGGGEKERAAPEQGPVNDGQHTERNDNGPFALPQIPSVGAD